MNARRLLAVLLVATALSLLSVCTQAATYRLPVRTATLVVSAEDYDHVGEPGVPYELYIDPTVLKFGYNPSLNLVYESAIIFDWQECLAVPETTGVVTLHLEAASTPNVTCCYIQDISAAHSVPQATDFDWWNYKSGVIVLWAFDPTIEYVNVIGDQTVPLRNPINRYSGWILTSAFCSNSVNEMVNPYVQVTTVPEPSSFTGLATAILALCGLLAGRRSARAEQ